MAETIPAEEIGTLIIAAPTPGPAFAKVNYASGDECRKIAQIDRTVTVRSFAWLSPDDQMPPRWRAAVRPGGIRVRRGHVDADPCSAASSSPRALARNSARAPGHARECQAEAPVHLSRDIKEPEISRTETELFLIAFTRTGC
jgi:hypothetical protein